MQTGDIVFVRGKGLISNIIRFFDKGEFNHVTIMVSDTEIIQADYTTRVKIEKFNFQDYEVVPMNLTPEEKEKVKEIAKQFVGEKYDWLEILDVWLRLTFGFSELKRFNNAKEVICSELVGYFLIDLKKAPTGVELLAPNELYKYLTSRG